MATSDSTAKRGGNGREGEGRPLGARASEVRDQAGELARAVRGMTTDLQGAVQAEVRAHPYRTVGIAALAGFVLGGGLSPTIMRGAVSLGGRLVVAAMLKRVLSEAGSTE